MAELEAEAISARIKQARQEAGLKQWQMAELLEVIPRTVQNYEEFRVPWDKLGKIAEVTGKSVEWLLHGDAGPAPLDRLAEIEAKLDLLLRAVGAEPELAGVVREPDEGEAVPPLPPELLPSEPEAPPVEPARTRRGTRRAG